MSREPFFSGTHARLGAIAASLFLASCTHDPAPMRAEGDPTPDTRPPRALAPPAAPTTTPSSTDVNVTFKCRVGGHKISPLIYGIGAQPDAAGPQQWAIGATARRWGGNHTSRYNWELGNVWNTGKDWYFKNVRTDRAPTPVDRAFIDDDRGHSMSTALTVPTIGWVAKDATSYSFPVSAFGAQQATEPNNPDVGNGLTSDGTPMTPGPPDRTSVVMSPASIGRWVHTIRARDAARGSRGVQIYILDNEPTLWSETHRDVHPQPVSYDELLERTIDYAAEIRRADPDALIAGPALWGFTAYFYSGVDKAALPEHPDQDAHGKTPLLPWWLAGVAAQEARTGQRLLDLVDVHFYPQGAGIGVGTSGDTDPETSARRIRSTRALWDPTYRDESWIGEAVALVPRVKAWIAGAHPGLGVQIGEYNFGAEGHMSGGLALAEALGRFGQQDVTSAFYWDCPPKDSPAFWAFRAYRNFDGRGGRFLDTSLPTTSDDPRASVFASSDGDHVVAVLLDLDPKARLTARIDASACGHVTRERAFAYQAGSPGLVPLSVAREGGPNPRLRAPLAPYSITVLDLHLTSDDDH